MPNTTEIQDESVVHDTSVEVEQGHCISCYSLYKEGMLVDDNSLMPLTELRKVGTGNALYYFLHRYDADDSFKYLCHEHSTVCEYDRYGGDDMCGNAMPTPLRAPATGNTTYTYWFMTSAGEERNPPNSWHSFSNDASLVGYTIDGTLVCPECKDDHFFRCEDCDNYYDTDLCESYGVDYGDRIVCDRCHGSYRYCDTCDTDRSLNDDDHYHDDDEPNNRNIHSYGYKQTLIMHQTDDDLKNAIIIQDNQSNWSHPYAAITHLGLELEVEAKNASIGDGVDILLPSIEDDTLILKYDGSLNNGFEIVSQPMTLAWAKENFPWQELNQMANIGFRSWNTQTCGLHVHVARDAFISPSHQAKFIHLIMRNGEAWRPIGGRTNTHWAKYERSELNNLPQKIKGRYGDDRYTAVNMCNRATLEIRIFRGSLKPERVMAALEFADACVEYTRKLSINEIVGKKGLNADEFIKWASTQEKYPNLNSYFNQNTTEGE
jgi:hypothetical protein